MKHIKIDPKLFEQKINCLKEAQLVKNSTEYDENDLMINRNFSLTTEGEDALFSLGYE